MYLQLKDVLCLVEYLKDFVTLFFQGQTTLFTLQVCLYRIWQAASAAHDV